MKTKEVRIGTDEFNRIAELEGLGDCFEVAGGIVMFEEIPNTKLVYGYVTGQKTLKGKRFLHAWVEDKENVYDYSNGKKTILPKWVYYSIGEIKKTSKFTRKEAMALMYGTERYGPYTAKEIKKYTEEKK